ncbi:hypothetical protein QR52_01500 [Bordetella pertussis]|nr:hypothetical protein UN82_18025 [Bordetella pertussis]ALX26969.1 hypothetical protein RD18_18030 [Bordetella pertussis]AMS53418.1 hypothetical protein RD08_18015 [Bordetella pertussis]AMS53691.1 hypothetical protein RD09_01495 [Bordetella pertussis]AMS60401.1 hypothetical protein RD11_01550 [Bordetella pertussis]
MVDLVGGALHHGLDRAVGQVLHPSGHAQHVGPAHGGVAVAHALHLAFDDDVYGFHVGVRHVGSLCFV